MEPDRGRSTPSKTAQTGDPEPFEVIVVGAGPAGTTAARTLALRGHSVLLLERDSLPRYKPCGGGLSPKTIARLPFPVDTLPHVRLQHIAFRLRGRSPVTWDLPWDFPFYMVMRSDLDHRLVQEATTAGAQLRAGEAVRGVRPIDGEFLVTTTRDSYHAPFVIAADGATGVVRHSLGLATRAQRGLAMECEVEVPSDLYQQYAATALFDVEAVPEGYGWIFPKRTHLSVGVGSMNPGRLPLRALFQQFLLRYQLASPNHMDEIPVYTHPLPVATSGEPARSGNALLVGDAAGVADGFGGEGICYAMASGDLAATVASRALSEGVSALESYEGELDRLLRRDQGQSNLMGLIVRRFPDAAYRILTSLGEGKAVLIPLLLGEITFGEALRRLPRLLALERHEQLGL